MLEGSFLKNIFFHAAILIPLEFGLLHATPLGPALTAAFHKVFAAAGLGALAAPAQAVGQDLVLNG